MVDTRHNEYCNIHDHNCAAIERYGLELAEIRGGVKMSRVWLYAIFAVMMAAGGGGLTWMNTKFDSIANKIEINQKANENFMMSSAMDRTQIRSRMEEIERDIEEIKSRLK